MCVCVCIHIYIHIHMMILTIIWLYMHREAVKCERSGRLNPDKPRPVPFVEECILYYTMLYYYIAIAIVLPCHAILYCTILLLLLLLCYTILYITITYYDYDYCCYYYYSITILLLYYCHTINYIIPILGVPGRLRRRHGLRLGLMIIILTIMIMIIFTAVNIFTVMTPTIIL